MSRKGVRSLSLIHSQMMRVISSPRISTIVPVTFVFMGGKIASHAPDVKGLTSLTACALIPVPAAAVDGSVAQLGERVVRNDEVEGSIPFASTTRRGNENGPVPHGAVS